MRWMRRCAALLLVLMLGPMLGCGTLFYRERIGQPRGKLDVVVVLLDSIGLVYFVVPGLIAFAVDFATGAIYLPRPPSPAPEETSGIQMRMLAAGGRDRRAIELALREVAGVELAARWSQVVVLRDCGELESLSQRLLELDAQVRDGELARGSTGWPSPALAFRSCAPR